MINQKQSKGRIIVQEEEKRDSKITVLCFARGVFVLIQQKER